MGARHIAIHLLTHAERKAGIDQTSRLFLVETFALEQLASRRFSLACGKLNDLSTSVPWNPLHPLSKLSWHVEFDHLGHGHRLPTAVGGSDCEVCSVQLYGARHGNFVSRS